MSRELLIALVIVVFGITIIALALRPKRGVRRQASSADGGSGGGDIPNTSSRRSDADSDNDSDSSSDGGGDGGGD